MNKDNPRLPQKGGAKKAVATINKFRKQVPSDRLVKIISETPDAEVDNSNIGY